MVAGVCNIASKKNSREIVVVVVTGMAFCMANQLRMAPVKLLQVNPVHLIAKQKDDPQHSAASKQSVTGLRPDKPMLSPF